MKRRYPLWLAIGLALVLAFFWLGWNRSGDFLAPRQEARPALWLAAKGDRQLYLFGTLHAVPTRTDWVSSAVSEAIDRSDFLVMEVTGLEAERRNPQIFNRLGQSRGLPPIMTRLGPDGRRDLQKLAERSPLSLHQLDGYESWAAALLINSAASSALDLSTASAPEAVLAGRFSRVGKPVRGLETIEQQLGIFDALPEAEQIGLLVRSLQEASDARRQYAQLFNAWARGDIAELEAKFIASLATSKALKQALIGDRNRRWARILDNPAPEQSGTAFVAVGAGHLVGTDGLIALLRKSGWKIDRIQ